ncbi:alpha/beta-hydrolase [Violaceomyces palustris]|uniref:Alpha/beta-hydrolase n=1 Tax=Violaceomyces palustris TaxID=1673888 RepID=A0ACD0NWL0_9BASI|nr:alpha/beta-hydrolase [Violaceomyces palustris]
MRSFIPIKVGISYVFLFALTFLATYSSTASIRQAASSISSGVRLLYQNDLDWNRALNSNTRQKGALLLSDNLSEAQASAQCATLSETLLLLDGGQTLDQGIVSQLNYLVYKRSYKYGQSFWVGGGNKVVTIQSGPKYTVGKGTGSPLPALCSQLAVIYPANATDASNQRFHVQTSQYDGVSFVGYRNPLSFRFMTVPFADQTERFSYSNVYTGQGVVAAIQEDRSHQCPQTAGTDQPYSEQCLFANVFTNYLPSTQQIQSKSGLKPIMLWIHGGGFSSGSGLDFTFDGGNLASRGDVVVVTPNYRLGTLGFLAYNDQIKGNFGLGDVITALRWVQKFGPVFGGDPGQVTIFGQSAGAQMVETLLASPEAAGLFHRAIIQSGRPLDQANSRMTIQAAANGQAGATVKALGCQGANDVLACLRSLSVGDFLTSSSTFHTIVQDGRLVDSPQLDLRPAGSRTHHVNQVPVLIGFMRDEMASLGTVPSEGERDLRTALKQASVSDADAKVVLDNPSLFDPNSFGGVRNLSITVETDRNSISRCGQEATIYAMVKNNVFPSVHSYTFDQRSYQIPNYDPNGVCQAKRGDLSPTSYYFCHSGDLLVVFGTIGSAFKLPFRDQLDLVWIRSVMDQWTSFARIGDPKPRSPYLNARGKEYQSTLTNTLGTNSAWRPTTSGDLSILSLGPNQSMKPLSQVYANQCQAFGQGFDSILKQIQG